MTSSHPFNQLHQPSITPHAYAMEPEEGELPSGSMEVPRGQRDDREDGEDGEILSSLDQRLLKNPLFNAFDPSKIPNNESATGMYPFFFVCGLSKLLY